MMLGVALAVLPSAVPASLHRRGTERREIVCATIEFGAGMLNPLKQAFPEMLMVRLDSLKELAPTIELFLDEAFGELAGRQTAVDRLAEYFLVLLLRAAIDARLVDRGVLMGLADARLAQALHAMYDRPEHDRTDWRIGFPAQRLSRCSNVQASKSSGGSELSRGIFTSVQDLSRKLMRYITNPSMLTNSLRRATSSGPAPETLRPATSPRTLWREYCRPVPDSIREAHFPQKTCSPSPTMPAGGSDRTGYLGWRESL
jgi:hypothetical protein